MKLRLEDFKVERGERWVATSGHESTVVPVYYHGKFIGGIGKDSLKVFDKFNADKKLEVLSGLLKLKMGGKI